MRCTRISPTHSLGAMTLQRGSVRVIKRMSQPRESASENGPSKSDAPKLLPGFVTRRLSRVVSWAERKNRLAALHGNPTIYDKRIFPWVTELEANWTVIRGELAQLMLQRDATTGSGETDPTVGEDRSWTTFALTDYFSRSNDIIARCPETWRLVQKVPGLVSAMFSVLEPGQRLPAHHGPYNGLLRCHLGLIVPEPREAVGIRIDGKVCHWDEGRALIFDDTFEHEARNESGSSRVVLFIDFEKPMKFPARLVNRRLLRSYLFSPFVREGSGIRGWWAKRAYQKARTLRAEREQAPQMLQEADIIQPRQTPMPQPKSVRSDAPLQRPLPLRPLQHASVQGRNAPLRPRPPGDGRITPIAQPRPLSGRRQDQEKIH